MRKLNCVGIWTGYEYEVSFKREGIARYIFSLTKALLDYSDLNIEFWVSDLNQESLKKTLKPYLIEYPNRIKIYSESNANEGNQELQNSKLNFVKSIIYKNFVPIKNNATTLSWTKFQILVGLVELVGMYLNWMRNFKLEISFVALLILFSNLTSGTILFSLSTLLFILYSILKIYKLIQFPLFQSNQLAHVANTKSHADVFLIPYIGLGNSFLIKKPKVMALHDLVTIAEFDKFMKSGTSFWGLIKTNLLAYRLSKKLAASKTVFVANSEWVSKNHILKFLPFVKESFVKFVYLPVNLIRDSKVVVDDSVDNQLIDKNIKYLFYPSQIRPYKGVLTLLKAFKLSLAENPNLRLVLTASNLTDAKLEMNFIRQNNLTDKVIFTGDVSDENLNELHKNAEITIVPTEFEGGIPWPILEALSFDTPIIAASIPQTVERLESFCDSKDNLVLFESENENDLLNKISYVLKNREIVVNNQQIIKTKISNYTWKDTADEYVKLFNYTILQN